MTWIIPAIVLGLAGSLHCLGMCGPIAFVLPVNRDKPVMQALQVSGYHLGRIFSYATIGFLFGLFGKSLILFGWQQYLSIGIGILMILIVAGMYLPWFKGSVTPGIYKLIGTLKSRFGFFLKRRDLYAFMGMGLLNGLLPCGLVYMAVLGALLTGSPWTGAGFMALFGLGTVPMMTLAVFSAGRLKGRFKLGIQRVLPILLLLFGILMVMRGLGLSIPYLSPGSEVVVQEAAAQINCH